MQPLARMHIHSCRAHLSSNHDTPQQLSQHAVAAADSVQHGLSHMNMHAGQQLHGVPFESAAAQEQHQQHQEWQQQWQYAAAAGQASSVANGACMHLYVKYTQARPGCNPSFSICCISAAALLQLLLYKVGQHAQAPEAYMRINGSMPCSAVWPWQ